MCGIGGYLFNKVEDNFDAFSPLNLMIQRMSNRGPDGNGKWLSDCKMAGFCHTRLAVIDVNDRSRQPMTSLCGGYMIVFNGEIYNYKLIRESLIAKGIKLRTTSDTEAILELFVLYGNAAFQKLRGMFAISIYEIKTKSYTLARDPYGIKPLYIAKCKNGWAFASQVKSLIASKIVSNSPSASGQFGFWLYGSVPEPYTWYEDITALQPGSWVCINSDGVSLPVSFSNISATWTNEGISDYSFSEVKERLQSAVHESIFSHLISDVPIGLFLSGGVDSGVLAGVMSESIENAAAITLKFDEYNGIDDESIDAAFMAKKYNMEHYIKVVNKIEFDNDIDAIMHDMDQPTIDGFNTWYASKTAAEFRLKVCLSGVGADEILCGYPSFSRVPLFQSIWNNASKYGKLTNIIKLMTPYLLPRYKSERICSISSDPISLATAYWVQRGLYSPKDAMTFNSNLFKEFRNIMPSNYIENYFDNLPDSSTSSISLLESRSYMGNQLLRDSDWASMAHGVELRTPFVDTKLLFDIVDLIPKFKNNIGKEMLSDTPKNPLPKTIHQKSKTGFRIPIASWIDNGSYSSSKVSESMSVAKFVAENY